jgi:hypothetical protein
MVQRGVVWYTAPQSCKLASRNAAAAAKFILATYQQRLRTRQLKLTVRWLIYHLLPAPDGLVNDAKDVLPGSTGKSFGNGTAVGTFNGFVQSVLGQAFASGTSGGTSTDLGVLSMNVDQTARRDFAKGKWGPNVCMIARLHNVDHRSCWNKRQAPLLGKETSRPVFPLLRLTCLRLIFVVDK